MSSVRDEIVIPPEADGLVARPRRSIAGLALVQYHELSNRITALLREGLGRVFRPEQNWYLSIRTRSPNSKTRCAAFSRCQLHPRISES